ncbi:MAG: hypothetical protein BGO97_03330 [Micrococcales bacterium 70-64]|nr:hypothetical protein [Leifsonia sp.]ODU63151.1 MAG: hypothetical protein ABT06_03335 [Leifsonia sp. SCN 70-46]OJX84842.1 MAG: hypothetical protein BGO97_03330 [Micrococcales bacterium 70-64]
MFSRRTPWALVVVFVVWFAVRPLIGGLLVSVGFPEWSSWAVFLLGFAAIVAAHVLVERRRAAPLRASLDAASAAHPGADVHLVLLDPEWNTTLTQDAAWLIVSPDGVLLVHDGDELLRTVPGDGTSSRTEVVAVRRLALVIEASATTFTLAPVDARNGSYAGRAAVVDLERAVAAVL